MRMRRLLFLLLSVLLAVVSLGGCTPEQEEAKSIGMAVEFMDHAACAYISQERGWYEDEGINLTAYESYATGMALASALARGDIEVAYICLVPAINAYANADIPLKIVAGTHKYGYGLVVNPNKIQTLKDLENPGVRIGCVREGGAVDVLFHKIIDEYKLDAEKIISNIQRMNPTKQVMAIQSGQLDAAVMPEQWVTMGEECGFEMLLTSQDVWPEMQGSVLVVKEDLITNHPETVRKLVKTTVKATDWANQNPDEAAEIVSRQLQGASSAVLPDTVAEIAGGMEISPDVLLRSMGRMELTTDIDPEVVQDIIDYIAELGYIKASFPAEEILDLRFLEDAVTP
jgi:NitT/TauT family transport system substrate-binding protein